MSAPQHLAAAALATSDMLRAATRQLAAVSDTPRLEAEVLLAFATQSPRSALLAFPERAVEPAAAERFAALLARRSTGEPVAYLTGQREFFSLALAVTRDVLVPRPETELLVEIALRRCAALTGPRVLDIGTGSGAVALALKHALPAAEVTGSDVSAAALEVARTNGARLALDVRWVESRWLDAFGGERFDVVVSNPPYVRSAELHGSLVLEPRLALDGGADGLDAYRKLLAATAAHLSPRGALLVEHGAEQREAIAALAALNGWCVAAAHDDLAGHARVLEIEPLGIS